MNKMPNRRKIVYIISNIDKALAFEWISKRFKKKFEVLFILLTPVPSSLETFLIENSIPVHSIKFRGKKDYISTIFILIQLINRFKPDIVHCHLFDASLLGLSASKLCGIKNRIYTRHHSTYNWAYNRKGIKWDWLINYLATGVIAISENVMNVLIRRERVKRRKIVLIPHGFELDLFDEVPSERVYQMKRKVNSSKREPVIGVIARWIEWKGLQYVIPAFKLLLDKFPNALLVLANSNGPYSNEVLGLLKELPTGSYQTIGFEKDIFALYKIMDVYVHTPVDEEIEAFGQTYVEALAAGTPSVFTLSGVAREFVNNSNAVAVPFRNSEKIYESIYELLTQPQIKRALTKEGKISVKKFSMECHIDSLENYYLSLT